jgi:hypothetical protein
LKESRGSNIFATPRGSLLSPGIRRGSKVFSPVSSMMANVLRSSFRESFVKRSPKKNDEDSDSEEENSDDKEEVSKDDSDSEGKELEKALNDEELLLLVCQELELMGDDGDQ